MAEIEVVPFGSSGQIQSLALRHEVLRKPLGLEFDVAELKNENSQIHLVARETQLVIGCLILVPGSDIGVKMRQVAVAVNRQGRGIGNSMVQFSESWCLNSGYEYIVLHARQTAVPFYQKLGYEIEGDWFSEVGIPHLKMKKILGVV